MLGRIAQAIATLALLAYPVAVYFGMTGRGPRFAALLMLALIAPVALLRLARWRGTRMRALALVPFVTVTLLALGATLDRAGFALAVPSAINLLLLVAFGTTLRWGPPMVERFARLQHPDLNADEIAWCRTWTALWCAFFALNATVAAVLSVAASLRAWAVYNGGVVYTLIGSMFAIEWFMRKLRFGRLGDAPWDRLFARLRREGGR